MNILFFSENFPPETNAAASRVFERACYWVDKGHKVTVITQAPNFPHGKIFNGYKNRFRSVEKIKGIDVVRVKTFMAPNTGVALRTLDFLSFMLSGILAGIFEKKPDIVIATSPQFFAAIAGWLVAKIKKAPFIFEVGDLWPASIVAVGVMEPGIFYRILEKIELYLYRSASCVVVLTSAFKSNLIERGIEKNKIAVSMNGVDLRRYKPTSRNEELSKSLWLTRNFVIGYVGTLGMAHGLENVIRAAPLVRSEPSIRFLFAGPGAVREQLIKEADDKGLGNILFLPPQPKEKISEVWSICDVALVHLKDNQVFTEVIPSKIFEAMAMGLPILLVAPKGAASMIIEEENAGLVVPPDNPLALAKAAIQLLTNETLHKKLAKNSRAAAHKHSREHQANQMIAAINAVISNKSMQVNDFVNSLAPPKTSSSKK